MPDASYLGLIGPRFLLRHPYGKRSDPILELRDGGVHNEDGLRGMLWGHPSLLAMCVLAVRGGQMTIDDLPFHHYVDADGDSVALPCTDRLINTHASTLLRDYGINGVMAHKGEALVRLAGLEAINGDGLAAPGGTGRKAPSDTRFALRSKPDRDDKVAVDWTPAQRKAGTVGVPRRRSAWPTTPRRPAPRTAERADADERPKPRRPRGAGASGGAERRGERRHQRARRAAGQPQRRRAAGRSAGGARRRACDGSRARSPAQVAA
jgi:type VI secretion system protein ImpC